jgi:hypothetical protein
MHEQWAWIIIYAHCSCSSGIRPRFFCMPGLAQFQKFSKKYIFGKICDFPMYFVTEFSLILVCIFIP